MRWWLDGPETPLLAALKRDFDATLEGPASTPRERVGRKRFYRLAGNESEDPLLVKVFSAPRGLSALASLGRPSKARREARAARKVAERGFRTARPVAVGEQRRGGLLVRSVSVVRELPARDLRAILLDPATRAPERRALVVSFAALNRGLHDAGIDQDDTSPNNFLVDPEHDWTLIDFERCRPGRRLGKRRWTLLAKLHRHDLGVSRPDRLRFLHTYLDEGDERRARRTAFEKIQREFLKVRRNDARRAARGAFRVGRHVGREGRAWFVKGREQSEVIRLQLDAPQCRAIWTLSHVFERLSLPALRPVRLDDASVDLLAPDLDEHAMEFHAAVARARKRFAPYGRWVREPQWALTPTGAILLTPNAFKLKL